MSADQAVNSADAGIAMAYRTARRNQSAKETAAVLLSLHATLLRR